MKSTTLPRIVIWKSSHLSSITANQGSKTSTLISFPLTALLQGLSLCSLGGQRKRQRCTLLQTDERPLPPDQEIQQLQDNHDHIIELPNEIQFKIRKVGSGAYLVVYESWDRVNYLQISNVQGYIAAFDGVLFVPTVKQKENTARDFISSVSNNSLWMNGIDVLNNDGVMSMARNEDLLADIPCIALDTSCTSMNMATKSSSWRTQVENTLREITISESQYQERQLRAKRRQYLYRQSLQVLNQLSTSGISEEDDDD